VKPLNDTLSGWFGFNTIFPKDWCDLECKMFVKPVEKADLGTVSCHVSLQGPGKGMNLTSAQNQKECILLKSWFSTS
jgi:hypothetical protein